jgi:glycerol-3-phosphate acyltransferase PlsY
MAVAAIAVVAHCFPVYLLFKGGKGVSTMFGTMFLFSPWLALASGATWAFVFAITRISSLSALAACLFTPLYAWLSSPYGEKATVWLVWLYCGIAAFVVLRHAGNIRRLAAGVEGKSKFKKDDAGSR